MTHTKTISLAVLAAFLGIAGLSATSSDAHAISIKNCTKERLNVNVKGKTGRGGGGTAAPNGSVSVSLTSADNPVRVGINVPGPDIHFSNQKYNLTYSLIRNSAGNIRMPLGDKCPRKPVDDNKDREKDRDWEEDRDWDGDDHVRINYFVANKICIAQFGEWTSGHDRCMTRMGY
ncbi:MAG: hypothetical protein WBD37_08395 [Anderseniella sp.]